MQKIDLTDYGFIPIPTESGNEIPARITAVHKERYEIVCEYGTSYARLKSSIYYIEYPLEEYPTTGDFVLIQHNPMGDSVITKTLNRKSYFSRHDPWNKRGEQAVAANFDYVFIMASLNYDFKLKRIERYLAQAWQSGAVPVVILTKVDLVDDFSEQVKAVEKTAIGVGVYAVSAVTGYGIDMLSEYVKPRKTIVLLGSSGVGKSSLVNALAGEEIMDVKEIREDDSKGRHTTTHRQMIMLSSGTMVIDTPGMRELGVWDADDGLDETFSDVETYFGKCKFTDCKHGNEPGCAIKAAIANGELSAQRWENYNTLKKEMSYAEDKFKYMRQKQEWHKSIAKWSKQNKKNGKMKK